MVSENQSILANLRLQRSKEDCRSAKLMCDNGFYTAANNRAYYCTFHAVRSLLALEGKTFETHSLALEYFRKEYISKGYFEVSFNKMIQESSESCTKSDYEDNYTATKAEAERNIGNAKRIMEAVNGYIARRINTADIAADKLETINQAVCTETNGTAKAYTENTDKLEKAVSIESTGTDSFGGMVMDDDEEEL